MLRFARAAGIAVLALAAFGVAGCAPDQPPAPPAPPPAPPAPLRACTAAEGLAAECGTVTAFENRATRQGRTIDIAFQVLRAESAPARDAVFLIAGGPGQAATAAMAGSAAGWLRPVRASLDLVLVDQRGTGQSNPLTCDNDTERDPASVFGHVFDPAWVQRCRAALEPRADLTQYGTLRAIDDLDDVRARLGYERISIYGGSYGTRVALAYANRYPDRVRSMVLDGVLPLHIRGTLQYASSAAAALTEVIAACRERPACAAANPDLEGDVARAFARFDAGPVRTTIRTGAGTIAVAMSPGDFGYALRGRMYDARAVFDLPGQIARAAATGDVAAFAQAYWERAVRIHRTLAHGMHLSVLCGEDVVRVDDGEIGRTTAGTFLGRYLIDEYKRACAGWPQGPPESLLSRSHRVTAPILLVSGRFDPVTPPGLAAGIVADMPMARHILALSGAHGSVTGCPRAAALQVLIHASLDGIPPACTP